MRTLRVALCQMQSHPAIYAGHVAYPEEPFVPKPNGPSLSRLGAKGIDVEALQDHCRKEYNTWFEQRLRSVIAFLQQIRPNPDIVLFPEGAVPLQLIGQLRNWSRGCGSTVLAGTHTPLSTVEGRRAYSSLGISAKQRKRVTHASVGSALPLIRNGKIAFIPKRLNSPFETTDVSAAEEPTPRAKTYRLQHTRSGRLGLLPLVCIEALQLPSVKSLYDVVGIVSYDGRPDQFQPFIDQQVRNKKLVCYCNDGCFGRTRFGAPVDERSTSWLHDTLPDGLPPGEAILVVDFDLDAAAVEVGTAVPRTISRLVVLSSIVGDQAPAAQFSRALSQIKKLPEGGARAEKLARALRTDPTNVLQKLRISYLHDLERRGQPSADWWKALGNDCIVDGQDDLQDLEARLSASCRNSLLDAVTIEAARRPDAAPLFFEFLAECNSRTEKIATSEPVSPVGDSISVVDRDPEVRTVAAFLDDRTSTVLEVTGLRQIGKSAVLNKAIMQSGIGPVFRVALTSTSSADYIVSTILKQSSGLPKPPYSEPTTVVRGASMSSAVRSQQVIIFERAHLLTDANTWRDEDIGSVLSVLVEVAREARVKLIFETQRELPLELSDPSDRQRFRVIGLQKERRHFGVAIFDAQLRKVGLSTEALSSESKDTIVERLGGHPVAIALAADATYDQGGEAVLKAVKKRKGFYLTFLEKLLHPLNLTDEDETVLRLLTLARVPVPRTSILATGAFPATPVLRNLIALGTVETIPDGRIEIAGVLRRYFDPRELPPELTESFHRAAAAAFEAIVRRNPNDLGAAVEAEFHGLVVGLETSVPTGLLDGALATAQQYFDSQRFGEAGSILETLLRKKRSRDVLRLAAQVAARRNDSDRALKLAREALKRDPKDTRLLTKLIKISLSQYQDDTTATKLVELARDIGVEDVSVLVAEGRIYLRRNQFHEAEKVFRRAKQLTARNPWPYYYLGQTYQRMGRLDKAINTLEDGREFVERAKWPSRNALNAIRTQLSLAYLFAGEIAAAGYILDLLVQEDTSSPEVIRAYAALTIKRDGIQMAEKAVERLRKAKIRNRFDRCQFHLFYGLFQLGINNPQGASQEFAKAHAADRSNVYVMMKWARTLYQIARERYLDQATMYREYALDCARLVQKILEFDPDNEEGINLMNSLHQHLDVDLGEDTLDVGY